ncbi:hypothetical protein TVAG_327100 [Trichomonas vaginalis G3]|uniref:Uncharacterized protein n=1 Tax=Trichomonas vaginalis (strain ATCC PRA-98 / G3) TaxID=412133 RepID=A2FTR2_TRIV3|nr:hypothetical protein TVAGG3_0165410 [Trichomonas vaginalis G3]EAX91701.1 hypothetical protein TVAG_327100 [Trichomonas vaginalis G3]KAI5548184.1 hypothetical protein TVAGG3_0165410 [Trichomonas vaginalis G3]|eukprot:XP_001304631.1 hypothetical protein [Trichomonas vaginalis G3]
MDLKVNHNDDDERNIPVSEEITMVQEEEDISTLNQEKLARFALIKQYIEKFVNNQCICCELLSEFKYEPEYQSLLNNINEECVLSNVHQFLEVFDKNTKENNALTKYWHLLLALFIQQIPLNVIEEYVIPYCNENYNKPGVGRLIMDLMNIDCIPSDVIVPIAFKLSGIEFVQAYITITFTYPHVLLNIPTFYQRLIEIDDPEILVAIRRKFTPQQIVEYGTQEFVLNKLSEERSWQAPGLKFLQFTAQDIGNFDEIGLKIFELSGSYRIWIKETMINYFHHFLHDFSNEFLAILEHNGFLPMIFDLTEGILTPQNLIKTLEILTYFLGRFKDHLINLYSEHMDILIDYATNSNDEDVTRLAENILKMMESITGESYI